MNFSQRHNLTAFATQTAPGEDFFTKELRIALWNAFLTRVFSFVTCSRDGNVLQDFHVFISLWKNFYKLPLDEYERDVAERKAWYRDQFEAIEWFRLLDLIEFVAQKLGQNGGPFIDDVNGAFEAARAPYRLTKAGCVAVSSDKNVTIVNDAYRKLEAHHLTHSCKLFHEALVATNHHATTTRHNLMCEALNEIANTLDYQHLPLSDSSKNLIDALLNKELSTTAAGLSQPEQEFYLASRAAAINLVIDAAVVAGRLSSVEQTLIKQTSLNIWGESNSHVNKED